jgi:hypothetical protein
LRTRLLGLGDTDVHRVSLDRFDEALGEERYDLGLIGVLERCVLNGFEERLEALHGLSASVDHRLDFVVEIAVADIVHVDGAERVAGGRGYDDVVVRVDAGVGGRRSEHGLEQYEEAAAIVTADGKPEIDVGVEDHLRERTMHAGGEVFVLRTMFDPDGVEVNIFGEGSEEGKNVNDLRGVGREFGLVYGGGQLGRLGQVEGQRDVLGEVLAAVSESVFADIAAESVPAGAGGGGGCNLRVDLFANLSAHGAGVGEIGVVAAGIERHGDVEKRLAGFKGDGRAARLRLSDTRGGF